MAGADAEAGKWLREKWCVLLSAGSGGDDPLAGMQGFRDSGTKELGSDSHQTAQELVMERSPKSDPAPGRGEDAWLFLPLGEKAAAGRRGDSKECLVGFF